MHKELELLMFCWITLLHHWFDLILSFFIIIDTVTACIRMNLKICHFDWIEIPFDISDLIRYLFQMIYKFQFYNTYSLSSVSRFSWSFDEFNWKYIRDWKYQMDKLLCRMFGQHSNWNWCAKKKMHSKQFSISMYLSIFRFQLLTKLNNVTWNGCWAIAFLFMRCHNDSIDDAITTNGHVSSLNRNIRMSYELC